MSIQMRIVWLAPEMKIDVVYPLRTLTHSTEKRQSKPRMDAAKDGQEKVAQDSDVHWAGEPNARIGIRVNQC